LQTNSYVRPTLAFINKLSHAVEANWIIISAKGNKNTVQILNKNSVRTTQETHCVSSTEFSRLMLFIVETIRNTQYTSWAECRVFYDEDGTYRVPQEFGAILQERTEGYT
jgi:hypothetical protein